MVYQLEGCSEVFLIVQRPASLADEQHGRIIPNGECISTPCNKPLIDVQRKEFLAVARMNLVVWHRHFFCCDTPGEFRSTNQKVCRRGLPPVLPRPYPCGWQSRLAHRVHTARCMFAQLIKDTRNRPGLMQPCRDRVHG